MSKPGKKYRAAAAKVDHNRFYLPQEALALAKDTSITKFDATVEVHMRMGLDPKQADQQVRAAVVMPAGLGKHVRVMVFAEGEGARLAKEAGADYVADDEMLKKIQEGWTDFDVSIAVPEMMGKVGRLGRILGTRGLMPNPKAGTVAPAADLPRLIKEAKAGRVEFRLDKTANIHVPIGKASFTAEALYDNFASLMEAIKKAKPAGSKGIYIKRLTVTTTMGPGVKVDANAAQSLSAGA
ncbi:MAG: 50S ribosomal protein L1 [Chloroflexi bacterium]|nr:50S ribosomal protein L1 [Chloroflexota bacterium]MBI5292192.1 50S ribosomal protein L1 [Chloroflexota bacterium]